MRSSIFESFLKRAFEVTGTTSQNELASILKVSRPAITQAKRKDAVPEKWILKLSQLFGVNPEWLEKGQGRIYLSYFASGFIRVPRLKARLSAGGGSYVVDSEIEDYYLFHKDWLEKKGNPNKMILMDIFGDSMEPNLRDGDTVLLDRGQTEILSSAIYAVGIDDVIMVKRIEKLPSRLVLRSDNKGYSPFYLQGDEMNSVRIIGRVIWICREYK
jgi:phage repressor protein C with HTH and peptisase S24 domain